MTALQEKLKKVECPDDARKSLNRVVIKNWRAFCTIDTQCSMSTQPLDLEELDPTRHHPKVKANRLDPI